LPTSVFFILSPFSTFVNTFRATIQGEREAFIFFDISALLTIPFFASLELFLIVSRGTISKTDTVGDSGHRSARLLQL
jgi:hypothetical protein